MFVRRRVAAGGYVESEFPRMAGDEGWNAGSETVKAGEAFPTADTEEVTADSEMSVDKN